jgi:hypothetical protein
MSTEITEFATEYTVCALPRDDPNFNTFAITVAWRGSIHPERLDHCWAATRHRRCLDASGAWDWEPSPSGREDDWLAAHRFTLEQALELARAAAPHVTTNGLSPADVRR